MIAEEKTQKKILKNIPKGINDVDILMYLRKEKVNWEYVKTLKDSTHFKDEAISNWLNVSVKTFRSYKRPKQEFNDNIKEHVLLLLSLFNHGEVVFGDTQQFENWLNTKNFFFDNKMPQDLLKTITGIRFINDRLTAMEYGDNV